MSVVARRDPSEEVESRWGLVYVPLLRDWLGSGETAWLPLSGSSMRPFLPAGARILVSAAEAGRIAPGDLVVFDHEGTIVCHRMLRRRARGDGDVVLTKGDGWRTLESWIPAAQLVGKVVGVERNGMRLSLETPARRLQARLIARWSRLMTGAVPALRRGRRRLGGAWRCVQLR